LIDFDFWCFYTTFSNISAIVIVRLTNDLINLLYNISVCGFKEIKYFDLWCFNATFNNISAISWQPALVVEEAGVPRENHRPWTNNW